LLLDHRSDLLDDSMAQRKKLEEENLEIKSKVKALRDQIKTIQSEFDDDLARISKEKSELEAEKEDLKERYTIG
jgi:peptidoglycan hydrolase CwlO-like protein